MVQQLTGKTGEEECMCHIDSFRLLWYFYSVQKTILYKIKLDISHYMKQIKSYVQY